MADELAYTRELRIGRLCWYSLDGWPPRFDDEARRDLVRIVQVGVDPTCWFVMPIELSVDGVLLGSGASECVDNVYLRALTDDDRREVYA